MSKLLIAALLLSFAPIAAARADCDNAATDQERAECIGQELRAADKTINDLYQALRASRDDAGKAALRTQQIQWLKLRDQTCQSASKETDREKWFANLLTDFGKTVCVVRFTNQRVAELTAEQASATAATPASAASEADVYDLIANHKPSNGKWYFEATIDVGALAKISESTIFIGVQGDGAGNTGSLQAIRKRNAGDGTRNIGIAVDLDVGKLYLRTNGAWQAQPGSANAPDLKLGRPYVAKLSSSVSLTGLPDGVSDLNFGAKPFAYALPDGYVPLDKAAPIRVAQPM